MNEESGTSSARYLKDHLAEVIVDTSQTSSAPGRLKLHDKKERPRHS